jgi:hypothetical protein
VPVPPAGPELETIRAAAVAFRAADRQLGGGHLYPVVLRYLQSDVFPQLIGQAHHPAAVFAAAASLTDMAGWLAYDDHRPDRAGQHFTQAFGLATAAGDAALRAQTLVSQSHLALDHERAEDAVRPAEAGLACVPSDPASAGLRARLHAMKARGAAMRGDRAACADDLRAAERELRRAAADGPWLSPFDEAALAAEAAICLRDLGQLAPAGREARRALTLRGADRIRSRVLCQLTLASVHLRRGDLDAACAAGGEALSAVPHVASNRVVAQLRVLGGSLGLHADAAPVAGSSSDSLEACRGRGLAGVVVAVEVLAGEGDEEAARLGLPAVEHGRRGHRHGAAALDRPADDRGDLAEAERDHAQAARGPAMRSDMLPHATGRQHIVGISKSTYVLATPRCLDWRHDLRRTGTNSGPPHPIAGVLVLLGRPNNGNHKLWMRAGRGRFVPRDGAALWRNANPHRGSGI